MRRDKQMTNEEIMAKLNRAAVVAGLLAYQLAGEGEAQANPENEKKLRQSKKAEALCEDLSEIHDQLEYK